MASLYALALFAAVAYVAAADIDDNDDAPYTQYLNCAVYRDEDGNRQKICTGQPEYVPQRKKHLQTRLNYVRQSSQSLRVQYHYIPQGALPPCDRYNDESKGCYLSQDQITPDFLYNSQGQARYILQDDDNDYQQTITYARCYDYSYTCHRVRYAPYPYDAFFDGRIARYSPPGHCFARFTTVTLWAYDPRDDHGEIYREQFRVPYCCRCIVSRNVYNDNN